MGKLDSYYRINNVAGVHIHLSNEVQHIQLCAVEANGNQLNINKKVIDLTAIAQLKEHLPIKTVISLTLSGKGILQKKTDTIENIDQAAFNRIFQSSKPEDFYTQNFVSGEHSFISIIRKTEADKWLDQLRDLSFQPLLLSLGGFPVEHIIPQLNVYEKDIFIDGYQINRSDKGDWLECKPTEEASPFPFKLGSEKIDDKLLIPYAAAFQLVMIGKVDPIAAAGAGALDQSLNSKLDEQKLKVNGTILLAVVFILLLANFILLSWFNSSNATLSNQIGNYAATNSNEQEITDKIKEKEALLHSLGWDGGINKSVLIDQVASLLPPDIKLREIAVNPVDIATSRIQKGMVFYDRKIVISGNSEKIMPVNEWIARIKSRSWVKNIQMENFAFDAELNTGKFTISINY